MSTIAEFEFDATAVPLRRLFEQAPGATVELERVVPYQNRAVSYLWLEDGDRDVTDGIAEIDGIARLTAVDEFDDRRLFRIEWTPEETALTRAITESGVTLLGAVGTEGGWWFTVRGDDRDAISRFHEACSDSDIGTRLRSVHRMHAGEAGEADRLTDPQRDALLLAYEQGYYDTPRGTSLSELADHLGISRQAVAGRLKRGTRTLLERSLVDDERDG